MIIRMKRVGGGLMYLNGQVCGVIPACWWLCHPPPLACDLCWESFHICDDMSVLCHGVSVRRMCLLVSFRYRFGQKRNPHLVMPSSSSVPPGKGWKVKTTTTTPHCIIANIRKIQLHSKFKNF